MSRRFPLTLTDIFVLAPVLLSTVLFASCTGALGKAREKAQRTKCANNLRQIGIAAISFSMNERGPVPHIGEATAEDGPGDVGKALAKLVQAGEIDDADVFICPSSSDVPTAIADAGSFAFADDDVTTSTSFSYGWTKRHVDPNKARSTTLITADRRLVGNHPDGRNVGRVDGSVDFITAAVATSDAEVSEALATLNLAD